MKLRRPQWHSVRQGNVTIAVPVSRCLLQQRIFPQIYTISNLDSNEGHFLCTKVTAFVYACQVIGWVDTLNTMILYASTKIINFEDGN